MMSLHIILIPLIQVALAESPREVSGYLGDTVTLPSGADPSWKLSTIEWSIFSNDTWIATYRNGKSNTDRVSRYKGRLDLNTSSGDLMIRNLSTKDDMEYTVDLQPKKNTYINKIKLTVKRRLQQPTVQTVACYSVKGGFWVGLSCSSKDAGVRLSWHVTSPVTIMSDRSSPVLLAFLNTTQNHVKFTCISSMKMENATRVITPKCDDDKPQPDLPTPTSPPKLLSPRSRYAIVFFTGVLVGGSLIAIVINCFGEQIKDAWGLLKENLFPSKN